MTNKTLRDGKDVAGTADPATASPVREDSQHTPGPWEIITADMLRGSLDLDPSALVIANLNAATAAASVVADVWTLGDNGAEQYANACLIAAAPELLAALKLAQEILERNDIQRREIDAAIAKAEGRS